MPFILKFFWALAVLVGIVNYAIIRRRVTKLVDEKQELADGADQILLGYLLFNTVPYALLALAQFAGGYLHPFFIFTQSLTEPFVLVSVAVLIVWWILLAYWIYWKDGARKLVAYELVQAGNEVGVKLVLGLALVGGVAGLLFGRMFFPDITWLFK
jgi:hypothetical protein